MPTPRATLIVLADGARARFFESHGVNKGVVAAPRALGSIRGFYGERAKAALRAEIDKDLVGADTSTIEKTLDNVLAV